MTTDLCESPRLPSKNPVLDDIIAKLWRQNYSSGMIASKLREDGYPVTRNAVIGRVYRMQNQGILDRKRNSVVIRMHTTVDVEPKNKEPVEKLAATKKQFIPDRLIKSEMIVARQSKYTELSTVDTGEGVSIIDVGYSECRWVMNFKRDGLAVCCGKEIHKNHFCEAHYNLCYYTPAKKIKSFGFR